MRHEASSLTSGRSRSATSMCIPAGGTARISATSAATKSSRSECAPRRNRSRDALLRPTKAGPETAGVETVSMGGCVSSSVGCVFSATVAPVEYE